MRNKRIFKTNIEDKYNLDYTDTELKITKSEDTTWDEVLKSVKSKINQDKSKDSNELNDFPGEEWRYIESTRNHYMVSNLGRIKRLSRKQIRSNGASLYIKEIIIKPCITNVGYYLFNTTIENKCIKHTVHRAVAEAFVSNPENKPYINHKNNIKLDNRALNLEWCTQVENVHHGMGFVRAHHDNKGELNPFSKLKDKDIIDIRKKKKEGMSGAEIARKMGLNKSTICNILAGKTWTHVKS